MGVNLERQLRQWYLQWPIDLCCDTTVLVAEGVVSFEVAGV